MRPEPHHYYVQGFFLEIAPGRRAQCDLFFVERGRLIAIAGVDLFDKEHRYLGFVPPHNLSIETDRVARDYIEAHRTKWVPLNKRVWPATFEQQSL